MRLPFFNHVGYNSQLGKCVYKRVELIEFQSSTQYTIEEMQAVFPTLRQIANKSFPINESFRGTGKPALQIDEVIQNGSRHNKLLSLAGTMRKRGMSVEELYAALSIVNKRRCVPPLDESEIRDLCQDVCKRYEQTSYVSVSDISPPLHSSDPINSSSKTIKKFKFTSLNDLLAEPQEDISFVLEKTLPTGGFSLWSAKPKVGKSTSARNLAVCVSRGEPFLGRETIKGKVLYLCLEEKRSEVKKHFEAMGASGDNILIYTGSTPDHLLVELEAAIIEHEPILVIIDPLSRVLRVRDFNDYGGMSRGLESFIDLARRTNCHILALHHDGKGDREGGDALLGSTALFGAVDCHIQMKKRENGSRTIMSTQRYGEDLPETVIDLNPESGIITGQGDLQAVLLKDKKAEVLSSMNDAEELTEGDIKERIGGKQGVISRAIRELYELGALIRNGEGKRGNPYTYKKAAINQEKVGQNDGEETRFSRSEYIGGPRNLENPKTNYIVPEKDLLFDSPSLQQIVEDVKSFTFSCWGCGAICTNENSHCPKCGQDLNNMRF